MNRIAIALAAFLAASPALAGNVCDYRPSKVVGPAVTKVVTSTATAVAAAGITLKAAGFYTMVHASSGATMLGSTLAGESAAGTMGIIAGTGKGIGAAAGFLVSPKVIVIAGTVVGVIVAFEGGCHIAERLRDDDD
jgi:hypothetical protein